MWPVYLQHQSKYYFQITRFYTNDNYTFEYISFLNHLNYFYTNQLNNTKVRIALRIDIDQNRGRKHSLHSRSKHLSEPEPHLPNQRLLARQLHPGFPNSSHYSDDSLHLPDHIDLYLHGLHNQAVHAKAEVRAEPNQPGARGREPKKHVA